VQVIARGKFPCYQPFNLSQFGHGCQMVYFQTKRPNLGKLWRALDCKMLLYFWPFGIFYGHLRYFITIWCIFSGFGVMHQEKSGNPEFGDAETKRGKKIEKVTIVKFSPICLSHPQHLHLHKLCIVRPYCSQGCQISLGNRYRYTKMGKIYQMTAKFTKRL
jgi:hypothetical protein